jgi:hypothetical protein
MIEVDSEAELSELQAILEGHIGTCTLRLFLHFVHVIKQDDPSTASGAILGGCFARTCTASYHIFPGIIEVGGKMGARQPERKLKGENIRYSKWRDSRLQ